MVCVGLEVVVGMVLDHSPGVVVKNLPALLTRAKNIIKTVTEKFILEQTFMDTLLYETCFMFI